MQQLVILVVAAAWIAVLIPPMLRSRVDNRPNSSVTDFRRQLSRLQNTTPPRGSVRYMGRPLAQSSPLQRQAAAGRPAHSQARHGSLQRHAPSPRSGGRTATATRSRQSKGGADHSAEASRYRSHGDSTGGQRRPMQYRRETAAPERRDHADRRTDRGAASTRTRAPQVDPEVAVKRRRTNVLFLLMIATACTMFLAATTSSTVMLYLFAAAFLGLCGYVYLLAQIREREDDGWGNGWLEQH